MASCGRNWIKPYKNKFRKRREQLFDVACTVDHIYSTMWPKLCSNVFLQTGNKSNFPPKSVRIFYITLNNITTHSHLWKLRYIIAKQQNKTQFCKETHRHLATFSSTSAKERTISACAMKCDAGSTRSFLKGDGCTTKAQRWVRKIRTNILSVLESRV